MLSNAEYADLLSTLDKGKMWLADDGWKRGLKRHFGSVPSPVLPRARLYLYLAVLENWNNTRGTINYITGSQARLILTEAQNLYRLCTCGC